MTMLKSRFARRILRAPVAVLLAVGLLASASRPAQDKGGAKGKQPDFIPAGYDDYQNLLDQLGIKKMRKGRDSKVKDTSDEATANRYKDTMPDLMTFKDGTKVKTADHWPKRRAEIVEEFEREVYGRVPRNVPRVKWEVTSTVEGESGGIATVTRTLAGHADNSAFPQIRVAIQASFTVPRHAAGKVPILLQFGGFGFGGKGEANPWTQQALNRSWGHGTINPNSIRDSSITTGTIRPSHDATWSELAVDLVGAPRGADPERGAPCWGPRSAPDTPFSAASGSGDCPVAPHSTSTASSGRPETATPFPGWA